MPSSRLPLRRYQTSVNNFFGMKTHSAESENAMNERCRHCGRRSTPPPTNTAPSLTSQEVETVINSLEKDLKRLLGNNEAKSYGAVKTAFLNWEKCNLDPVVHDETVKLQTLLREDYHFDAGEEKDIYRIPSSHSTQELNDYISSLILGFSKLKTGGKDKLLIVYYNGHGGVNPTTKNLDISGGTTRKVRSARSGKVKDVPVTADWSPVQKQLESVNTFDVLLLMDCCYAARLIKTTSNNAMEVICASSREVTASMDNTGSWFTKALIKHLRDLATQPNGVLVSELYTRLHQDPDLDEQSPNHTILRGHHRPITVKPLAPNTSAATATFEDDDAEEVEDLEDEEIDVVNDSGHVDLLPSTPPLNTFDIHLTSRDNYVALKAMFDTGTDVNIISEDAATLLDPPDRSPVDVSLVLATGQQLQPVYTFNALVTINLGPSLKNLQLEFMVLPKLPVDVVIGRRALQGSEMFDFLARSMHRDVESALDSRPNARQETRSDQIDREGTQRRLVQRLLDLRHLVQDRIDESNS